MALDLFREQIRDFEHVECVVVEDVGFEDFLHVVGQGGDGDEGGLWRRMGE